MFAVLESFLLLLTACLFYVPIPVAIVWGWVRWLRNMHPRSAASLLSLAGLGFATSSELLLIFTTIYAHKIGGFPFYDPMLLRIYRWGGILSLAGIVFGIAGAFRPNPIRWLAPACAVGMFLFWGMLAMGE